MFIANAVALVTGANKGIGRETARQLAERGAVVLLGSRDPERGRRAAAELACDGVKVLPVTLDVTDEGSVAGVAERIRTDHGALDILVNNAGTFVGAAAGEASAAQLRTMFEVNVFGVVTVTRLMLPWLKLSAVPRIVNVSSTTASLTLTSTGVPLPGDAGRRMAYTSSKAALNMLTVQYARAFANDRELAHVKVNSASPGYTATDMNGFQGLRSVQQGARVIVRLATLPHDGPSGGFFDDRGALAW